MFIETGVATIILLAVASTRNSQDRPDFSGEWILNRQASTLSPGADAAASGVWQIEHREPTFRHKASFVMAGKPFNYEYELRSDAAEIIGTHEGTRTVSSLRWEGNTLVVMWRTERAGSTSTISFKYDLIEDGRCLRATEQVRGTDHDQDNVWMFERG
ncbi:MAG TPA: hypothetical protein VKB50_20190 [Vicinamibacterales bacterium]|nr:hypothetical protein [Vicinamibacterales bacterium]